MSMIDAGCFRQFIPQLNTGRIRDERLGVENYHFKLLKKIGNKNAMKHKKRLLPSLHFFRIIPLKISQKPQRTLFMYFQLLYVYV